jgi:hypothetical protein
MLILTVCASGAQQVQTNVKRNTPAPCECSVNLPPAVPDVRGTEPSPLIVKAALAKSAEEVAKDNQDRAERQVSDRRTLWLSGITAVILTLQLVVFGLQAHRLQQSIKEMKIATEATKTAAHAAETTVETMNATARRQLRAYVAIDDSLINRVDQQAQPEAVITIKNYGQTPAYQFAVSTQMALVSSFDEALPVPEPDSILGHLAPGAEFTVRLSALFTISNAQYAQLPNGAVSIFVYGIIRYVDTFGKHHFTRFRTMIGGRFGMPIDKGLFTCHEGNNTDDDQLTGADEVAI